MPYIENQPYYAEVVDQGFHKAKSGKTYFKLFTRLIGTTSDPANPEPSLKPVVPTEVTVLFDIDCKPEHLQFKLRDLKNLGFVGDESNFVELDPRNTPHQSLVGKKMCVKPRYKEGSDINDPKNDPFWDPVQGQKRFKQNDFDLSALEKKKDHLKKAFDKLAGKKTPVAAGEAIPF